MDRAAFFAAVKQAPFHPSMWQSEVDGCNVILDERERRCILDLRVVAYIMATVYWETDQTMQPIREGGGINYLKAKSYYPWYGRGYVQLTWKANYAKFRDRVLKLYSVDIIAAPDLAMKPDVACFILFEGMLNGEFTGKKLADYFGSGAPDWWNARRIINGTDRAGEIAAIAKQFYADLMGSVTTTGV